MLTIPEGLIGLKEHVTLTRIHIGCIPDQLVDGAPSHQARHDVGIFDEQGYSYASCSLNASGPIDVT